MGEPYLDTNIIVRFLTGDNPEQQASAKTLFEQIELKCTPKAGYSTNVTIASGCYGHGDR